jgi:hypothetical protein
VGLILANVLEQLFTEAFKKMRTPTKAASTTEGSGDLADDGSFDWHKVAGRRLSRVRAAVASRVWRVSLVMLAIFTEPLRMMTRFFAHCSSTTHRHCSPPYLVDLANPASDCGTIFVHVAGPQARPCRVVAQGSLFDWIAPWRKDSAFQSFAHLVKFSGNIQVSFVVSLGV